MASPQKENGYTAIANELLEKYCKLNLFSVEWKVLLFILRKTYGYGKKSDHITLSQFRRGCSISGDRQLCRVLKRLLARVLVLKGNFGYMINKNHEEWVLAPVPTGTETLTPGTDVPKTLARVPDTIVDTKVDIQKRGKNLKTENRILSPIERRNKFIQELRAGGAKNFNS